jgi:hypothetical protein
MFSLSTNPVKALPLMEDGFLVRDADNTPGATLPSTISHAVKVV